MLIYFEFDYRQSHDSNISSEWNRTTNKEIVEKYLVNSKTGKVYQYTKVMPRKNNNSDEYSIFADDGGNICLSAQGYDEKGYQANCIYKINVTNPDNVTVEPLTNKRDDVAFFAMNGKSEIIHQDFKMETQVIYGDSDYQLEVFHLSQPRLRMHGKALIILCIHTDMGTTATKTI